jgi:SAM-dependent methyltransferase
VKLMERLKLAAFQALLCVGHNPRYEMRRAMLTAARDGNLARLARETGIRQETLEWQRDSGLDNPAYRFERDQGLLSYLVAHAGELKGCSWLDVGADTGAVSVYLSEIFQSTNFALCDVTVPARTNFPVREIDGTRLDYERDSFDLVFFSYVLHHASENTISLLRDAHRIARRHVIVAEDPKVTETDYRWAYQDDPRGTFRGLKEWRDLFALLGFALVHDEPLDCRGHSRHFFLLAPNKT